MKSPAVLRSCSLASCALVEVVRLQSINHLFAGFEVFHENADAIDQVLAFFSS